MDLDILTRADVVIYKDQDDDDWSPYALPRPLLTVWAVTRAHEATCNGGFEYFFENDWPENPPYSVFVEAFREIGALEAASYLQQAVENFPFPDPHLHVDKRCEHLVASRSNPDEDDSIIDELGSRLSDLDDDTYTKIEAYILANPDSFPELPPETIITDSNLPAHLKRPGWMACKFLRSEVVIILPETFEIALQTPSASDFIEASSERDKDDFTATLHTDPYFLENPDFALDFVTSLAQQAGTTAIDMPPYRFFGDPNVLKEGKQEINMWVIGFPGAVLVISLAHKKGKPYTAGLEQVHQAIPQICGMLL